MGARSVIFLLQLHRNTALIFPSLAPCPSTQRLRLTCLAVAILGQTREGIFRTLEERLGIQQQVAVLGFPAAVMVVTAGQTVGWRMQSMMTRRIRTSLVAVAEQVCLIPA